MDNNLVKTILPIVKKRFNRVVLKCPCYGNIKLNLEVSHEPITAKEPQQTGNAASETQA